MSKAKKKEKAPVLVPSQQNVKDTLLRAKQARNRELTTTKFKSILSNMSDEKLYEPSDYIEHNKMNALKKVERTVDFIFG